MNNNLSSLSINRMVAISKTGEKAYDELFHSGVNILRGHNSSGKSTIANLIFYGLGGDYFRWTDSAQQLDSIYVEVQFNESIVTLKRQILSTSMGPMYIYWDKLNKALSDSSRWNYFSYKKTKDNNSFSDILFNLMQFPEVKSDSDEKITMHQLLRLLYIDQDSLTQSLFRTEKFDSSLIRQTTSELLFGLYNDELYHIRQRQLELKKLIEIGKNNLLSLYRVFEQSGMDKNVESINIKIEETKNEIVKIQSDINDLNSKDILELSDESKKAVLSRNEKLTVLKSEYNNMLDEITKLEYEIEDSSNLIRVLNDRIHASFESKGIRDYLKDIKINFCPHCLQEIKNTDATNICHLCKEPMQETNNDAQFKRIEFELSNQIKESKKIKSDNIKLLTDLKSQLNEVAGLINFQQTELDILLSNINSGKGIAINELHKNLGNLENQLNAYSQQIKYVEVITETEKELQVYNEELAGIKVRISTKEKKRSKNEFQANQTIQNITLHLLKNDLDRQQEFQFGNSVNINYYDNTFDLNGKHNFSASSNVYFKNSILYALFFASLELNFFRYPRFILCDNMEDKGMEPERSKNFQNLIVSLSKISKIKHQIIFTTSMIDDSLNNSELCVGEFYTETNKSLKLYPQINKC